MHQTHTILLFSRGTHLTCHQHNININVTSPTMHPTLCHSILMEQTYPQIECTIFAIPIHHYTNTNMSHQNISIMHTSHHNVSSWFCLDRLKGHTLYTPPQLYASPTHVHTNPTWATPTPAPTYTHFDLQPIRAYPRHQP